MANNKQVLDFKKQLKLMSFMEIVDAWCQSKMDNYDEIMNYFPVATLHKIEDLEIEIEDILSPQS